MPTYLDVVTRVQDDCLNRTTYSTQVRRAILSEIRLRERKRYWFNETQTAITAVSGQEWIAKPSNLLVLDRLELVFDTNATGLIERDINFIRDINQNGTNSVPQWFCQYQNKFLLANIPDSAYSVPCFYIKQLPVLSADSDTNKWLSAAEDVIVYGAAKKVWAVTVRNASAAAVCAQLQQEAINELNRMNDQQAQGRIKPTRF